MPPITGWRKASEWRTWQGKMLRSIAEHQTANQTYLEEGVRLLELTQRARELFQRQEPLKKRRLPKFPALELLLEG